jgi:hypothetical protein
MLVKDCAVGNRYVPTTEDHFAVLDTGEPAGSDVVRAMLGNYNEMCVGDAEAVYDEPHALWLEDLPHPPSETLCNNHYPRSKLVFQISEVIHMDLRDDKTLARSSRA